MKIARINQLKKVIDEERISYGEIAEIDSAAREAGIEVTDEMMSIDVLLELETLATLRIYDNGGKTLDRFTVVTNYPFTHDRNSFQALGMSEGGDGFSQFGEAMPGRHLGKRITIDQLSEASRSHLMQRLFGKS